MSRRPRLLVFNQYYWPGVEATATLLSELCRSLAKDFDVKVITGTLRGSDARAGTVEHDGVKIVRVRSTAYDRTQLSLRALNYVTYLVESLRHGLLQRRPDVVLCMTDPPMIGDVALLVARRFRAPLVVVSQDIFPEVAVELRRLENPALVTLLRILVGFYLKRADRVVAIGQTMSDRLIQKGVPPERIRIIPNWVDTTAVQPAARSNDWTRANGLTNRFVVMHSGNVGHAQDLDSLIRAATFLRDLPRLSIVVIGMGARHAELVRLADRLEVDSVVFLPYQPRSSLSLSLSTADLHVVGLAQGLSGYVVPSRVYGILAVGRPIIAAAEADSETAQLVASVGCGVVVPPARPELLAAEIRRAYEGRLELEEMGRRARDYVSGEASTSVAVARYRDVLAELTQMSA